jgi:predicted AAA+ superfamily ATPase
MIDEIQKVPLLLDEVHKLITEEGIFFALTGSSARKLKKAGVNLLAGRASQYKLYPLTFEELGSDFDLISALSWGTLPETINLKNSSNKEDYLYAYVDTYLKQEIVLEQLVRNIQPFSSFLQVAAATNGESVVYENIAKDTGVTSVSIKTYFEILEDTLIGFNLPPYHSSKRKRFKRAPKFYFHDLGVVRALKNILKVPAQPGTFEFGNLFETFIINEIVRLNEYRRTRFELSHMRIDDSEEIDLIVERPGARTVLIEIKSKEKIDERDTKTLNKLYPDFDNAEAYLFSRDKVHRTVQNVQCLEWRAGLAKLFEVT